MKYLSKIFLAGMLTVLPVLATIYLLVWLFTTAESFLGEPLKILLPEGTYVTGMGLVAGVAVIFVVGVLMRAYIIRTIFEMTEKLLLKVPLIKTIYSALREFFGLFADQSKGDHFQVVMVNFPEQNLRLLGFITREDFSDMPTGMVPDGHVSVYMPMSYQIGGYTVYLPKDRLTPVDIPREHAMRLAVTAGIKLKKQN